MLTLLRLYGARAPKLLFVQGSRDIRVEVPTQVQTEQLRLPCG